MYRINIYDVTNMALEYSYRVFKTTIFDKDEIENYVDNFFKKLKESDIEWTGCFFGNQDYIYDYVEDKNRKGYYIIDLEKLNSPHDGSLGILPLEILELSQKKELLATLGIELRDGYLVRKEEQKTKIYRK